RIRGFFVSGGCAQDNFRTKTPLPRPPSAALGHPAHARQSGLDSGEPGLLHSSIIRPCSVAVSLLAGAGRTAVGRLSSCTAPSRYQRRSVRRQIPASAQALSRRAPSWFACWIRLTMDWRSGSEVIRPRCCRCPTAHSAFFAAPTRQPPQPALFPCIAVPGAAVLFPLCRRGSVGVWPCPDLHCAESPARTPPSTA